jgi:hypothetical protein
MSPCSFLCKVTILLLLPCVVCCEAFVLWRGSKSQWPLLARAFSSVRKGIWFFDSCQSQVFDEKLEAKDCHFHHIFDPKNNQIVYITAGSSYFGNPQTTTRVHERTSREPRVYLTFKKKGITSMYQNRALDFLTTTVIDQNHGYQP